MKLERIVSDVQIHQGQPRIRGTRLTVRHVLRLLGEYESRSDLRRDYPQLDDASICEALAYARATLDDELVELSEEF